MGTLFGLSTQGAFLLSAQDARALPSGIAGKLIQITQYATNRQPGGDGNPGNCRTAQAGTVGSCQRVLIYVYVGSAWGDDVSPVAPTEHEDLRTVITGRSSGASLDASPDVVDTLHCTTTVQTTDDAEVHKSSAQTSPKDSGDWPEVWFDALQLNPGASNEYWSILYYENDYSNTWTVNETVDLT